MRNKSFLIEFVLLCTVCLFCCCKQHPGNPAIIPKQKDDFKPPVVITSKNPVIISLDTCPPPNFIYIPVKAGKSHVVQTDAGISITEPLIPPQTTKSDLLLQMQSYNTEQGLAFSGVLSSYCDKKGNLWFGTNGSGISRYDGKSFTNFEVFPLSNAAVFTITEDSQGNLWFGTISAGAFRYDGKTFRQFTKKQGLAGDFVSSIKEDKSGDIWFGTSDGLSHITKQSLSAKKPAFTNYTPADGLVSYSVSAIIQDRIGNLWIATGDSGVSRYDGKSFTNFTTQQGLANNSVYGAIMDRDGNLWFATAGGGVSRYDGKSFKNYTEKDGLCTNYAVGVFEEKNGDLWFHSRGLGISKLDYKTKALTNYTKEQGLFSDNIWSMSEDKSGNLWFGSFGSGVARLTKSFTHSTHLLLSIFEDKDANVWLGSDGGGIARFQANKNLLTRFSTSQGLPNNHVLSILQDKQGLLWLGTDNGLVKFDLQSKSFTTYTPQQGLVNKNVNCVYEDNNGNIWLGTYNGLSKFDNQRKTFTNYTTTQGLAGNYINGIMQDEDNNLWICTGDGLTKFDGRSFTNYTTAQGLADNNVVNGISDKSGNLWFAVYGGGLARLDSEQKAFTSYRTEDGLSDDKATTIALDTSGNIWLGTEKGLTMLKGFNKQINDQPKKDFIGVATGFSNKQIEAEGYKPLFEIYNTNTGYPVKTINSNAMHITRSNIIWGGTTDQLFRFDPAGTSSSTDTPAIFIQKIKVGNQDVCWHDLEKNQEKPDSTITAGNLIEEATLFGKSFNEAARADLREKYKTLSFDSIAPFYPIPVNLTLPYQFNSIQFDFASIEPWRPNLVRYQYILEGYNDTWSIVNGEAKADFGNIHEGTYTFKLKAQSPQGVWSRQIAYTFKVLAPWYRAWWAYGLYLFLFLLALWIFIKWRERTLTREKAILENKVKTRTLELTKEKEKVESTLSQLKSTQSQLIQSEKMASLGQLTAGIAHEIQNPLNFVNNFSEVNKELLLELKEEIKKGNIDDANAIANDAIENSEKINHHGKRADAIVKGMLEHSRQGTGQKELTDINALADEYIRLAYNSYRTKDPLFKADIQTSFDTVIGKINIVPQDVGRVLLNIYNNAFYAVNEKAVSCRLRAVSYEPTVSISTKKKGDRIEIVVADNGSGISQNNVDKIFQPFFTTKPTGQGTGLGLSLAYDIVKAHGGEIKAETNVSAETVFTIQLPVTNS
jgi:ligand-binding sensor domain-containing protein/signal transduction histidine kinase